MTDGEEIRLAINLGLPTTRETVAAWPHRSKVLIPASTLTASPPQILFDYPLSGDFPFPLHAPRDPALGYTYGEDIDRVLDVYDEIYETERQTSTVEEGMMQGMMNRNRTDGKYGIYGHVLSDLVLTALDYEQNENTIYLGVDS